MQLLCVPLFIKLMGVDGYGLVGFYLTLQASLQVLDLGISPTLNRELARYSAQPDKSAEGRDFVWTLQAIYWTIGAVLGLAIAAAAPAIATRWIQPGDMAPADLVRIIELMGLVIAVQWPLSFYQGGLIGLQRQVLLNAIRIGAATLSYGGAVIVLWQVSRGVDAFLLWQAVVGGMQVALLALAVWLCLPGASRRARFDFSTVRGVARFAGAMGAIALAGIVISQMDKVVLSRFLSLDRFGYYVLAGVVAGALQLFITPIFSVIFPRLSAMVVTGDAGGIRRLYHAATQLMAVLVLPTAVVLSLFAPEVIALWTGDARIATEVAPIAALLLIGTAINGLMHVPYALQLAHGWTRIGLQFALFKVVVFVPLLVWAASRHGAVGGAAVWALLNATYLLLAVPLTHRRLLRGEAAPWAVRDVLIPLLGVCVVAWPARQWLALDGPAWTMAMQLAGVALAAFAAAALAAAEVRAALLRWARARPA